ncbi:hypothetical protein [Variovorax sp. 350MFTsu5.1]|uniref:hypothetical protein n=1 Tax=Variovorax sp. 350MFTsu5.1 TaxID=3158365 RepID=UPI003AAB9BB3
MNDPVRGGWGAPKLSEAVSYILGMNSSLSIPELVTLLLSSAVVSALVTASLNGVFGRLAKKDEYKNAYYKLVLDRRMKAYELIEELIVKVKIAIADEDGKTYHIAFAFEEENFGLNRLMVSVMGQSMWLSDELFQATRKLNVLMYSRPKVQGWIDFGKANYQEIANLRTEIEQLVVKDMMVLHDIPQFLRRK